MSTTKKAIRALSWLFVFAVITLCAAYSMGANETFRSKSVVQKEYTAGGSSYRYSGILLDGMFSGTGQIHFSGGDNYSGEFVNGRFDGNGVFSSSSGWTYYGEFSEGRMTGNGTLFCLRDGVLTMLPESIFTYESSEGWTYTGLFNERGQTGTGRFIFPDGAVYEGEFVRGMAEGVGSYISPDGWSYEGSYSSGLFNGEGRVTKENSDISNGVWLNGEQIEEYK